MSQARSYSGTDANFINFAGQGVGLITEKHDDFVQFTPIFTAESLNDLTTVYNEACNIPSDNTYVDIQAKATESVKLKLEQCCKFFQRCKFDIEIAFPNDKKMWDQFGFNDYEEARRNPKFMYMFLTDLHMIAMRNAAPLVTVGWTDESFELILNHRDSLKLKMNTQSDSIMDRSRATEDRVLKLNNLYEKLAIYFKAARILYDGNEEILKWFKFPASTVSKNSTEAENENSEETTETEQ